MNKQSVAQKKIAASNLKSMLNIFCVELDNIIRASGGPVQAPPQPQPVDPGNIAYPDIGPPVEPNLPVEDPGPLVKKPSWDVDGMDPAALEEQRRILEQIERQKN